MSDSQSGDDRDLVERSLGEARTRDEVSEAVAAEREAADSDDEDTGNGEE